MNCFVWNEYIGKKTADEILSVTWQLFKEKVIGKFKKAKIWSDNCVSQNMCWKILFFYAYLVKKNLVRSFFKKTNNDRVVTTRSLNDF
jgi:hypothetical protein